MASEAVLTRTRAEDIEGLRALISQVMLEERDKIIPVSILQDVEKIKRSPVGAVIRMEGAILHLQEDVAGLKHTMATKEELRSLQQVMEARFGQVDERITGLQQVTEARFGQVDERIMGLQQVMETRFGQMDKHFRQINVRINSTFGILITLIIAILIKLFLG